MKSRFQSTFKGPIVQHTQKTNILIVSSDVLTERTTDKQSGEFKVKGYHNYVYYFQEQDMYVLFRFEATPKITLCVFLSVCSSVRLSDRITDVAVGSLSAHCFSDYLFKFLSLWFKYIFSLFQLDTRNFFTELTLQYLLELEVSSRSRIFSSLHWPSAPSRA